MNPEFNRELGSKGNDDDRKHSTDPAVLCSASLLCWGWGHSLLPVTTALSLTGGKQANTVSPWHPVMAYMGLAILGGAYLHGPHG